MTRLWIFGNKLEHATDERSACLSSYFSDFDLSATLKKHDVIYKWPLNSDFLTSHNTESWIFPHVTQRKGFNACFCIKKKENEKL